jgi:mycothiol synthase
MTETNATINMDPVPDIAGLRFRPLQGAADFGPMAEVGRLCNLADQVLFIETAQDLANLFAHEAQLDPARDVLLAEVDGALAGYARVKWKADADGSRYYQPIGFVAPEWRRRGLGRALLRWSERRLREIAATHPAGVPRSFRNFSPTSRVGKVIMLEREGYQAVRHFYDMERSLAGALPDAPLPAGFEIRPVQPEHLHTIWEANNLAFAGHWGSPPTEADYPAWLKRPNFDPGLWQIAWEASTGRVAGVAINEIDAAANREFNRQAGVVGELSVGRPWRGRGLGRALLVRSLAVFQSHGLALAALGVDSANATGALGLYESVGFRVVGHGIAYAKEMSS